MSARECKWCGGAGKQILPADPFDDTKGWINVICDQCDGTGRVWPSVEGEQSAVFDGLDPAKTDMPDLEVMVYEVAIESKGRMVRVIVQPAEDKP